MLDGLPVSDISAAALLAFAVLLILTGRLVPVSVLKEKVAEAERWRNAYELEREARALVDDHAKELLELAKTTHAVVVSTFNVSSHIHQDQEGIT